jgi:hypothetical protein
MLTVAKLLAAADGLDPDALVIGGIMNGPRFNAAYADQQVCAGALALYICCYEDPRPWEGPAPTPSGDGTATLEFDPADEGPRGNRPGKGA